MFDPIEAQASIWPRPKTLIFVAVTVMAAYVLYRNERFLIARRARSGSTSYAAAKIKIDIRKYAVCPLLPSRQRHHHLVHGPRINPETTGRSPLAQTFNSSDHVHTNTQPHKSLRGPRKPYSMVSRHRS